MADPTYYQDILPLFTPLDIECMRGLEVYLASYKFMTEPGNANRILRKLKPQAEGQESKRMPLGGPYWSQDSLDLFEQWMKTGMQEGTPPDNLPPEPEEG
jgi:hypothetical protein